MADDFSKYSKEDLAHMDQALEFLSTAQSASNQGAVNRAEIEKMGGIAPDKLRLLAQYRIHKYDLKPDKGTDENLLRKHGVPDIEIQRIKANREGEWRKDRESFFDAFSAKPVQEMAAETITASPRKPVAKPTTMTMPKETFQAPAMAPAAAPAPQGQVNVAQGVDLAAALPPGGMDQIKNMTPQQAQELLKQMGMSPEQAMQQGGNTAPLQTNQQPVFTMGGQPVR